MASAGRTTAFGCFYRRFCHLLAVIASQANDDRSTEKLLLRAFLLSMLLHFLFYGVWKTGEARGWWHELKLPRWMQLISKTLTPKAPVLVLPPRTAPSTMYVDVDPETVAPQPPKETKYYGSHNTVAANKEIKTPSLLPNVEGRQEKVVKTTENAPTKAVPLQPTPPAAPQPQVAAQSPPKKTEAPGDLAMVRPSDKTQEKDGQSQAETAVQPQPYQRPRTVAEALARKNGTLGEPMRQVGGVNNLAMKSALDVAGSPIGAYDEAFVAAVRARWWQLLENRHPPAGKVVVEFRMHPDGRITNVKIDQNEVSELWGMICQQAILDPAPYLPWPKEMRLAIAADFRDVQFTFFYELE
jgi:outer membrane biosynthesis protein TonB